MMKKLLTLVMLVALVFFILPKEVFCSDHSESEAAHHHCNLTCHTCFNVVVPVPTPLQEFVKVSSLDVVYAFSYKSPAVSQLIRPPIGHS